MCTWLPSAYLIHWLIHQQTCLLFESSGHYCTIIVFWGSKRSHQTLLLDRQYQVLASDVFGSEPQNDNKVKLCVCTFVPTKSFLATLTGKKCLDSQWITFWWHNRTFSEKPCLRSLSKTHSPRARCWFNVRFVSFFERQLGRTEIFPSRGAQNFPGGSKAANGYFQWWVAACFSCR